MALKFDPFAADKPAPVPLVAKKKFKKIKVFEDPSPPPAKNVSKTESPKEKIESTKAEQDSIKSKAPSPLPKNSLHKEKKIDTVMGTDIDTDRDMVIGRVTDTGTDIDIDTVQMEKIDKIIDTVKRPVMDTVKDRVLGRVQDTKKHTVKDIDTVKDRVLGIDTGTVQDIDTDTVRNRDIDTVLGIDTVQKNYQYMEELSRQQKKALFYLLSIRDYKDLSSTRPVGYAKIAKKLGSKRGFAQKCINSLILKGFLFRKDSFNKMIKGTVYGFRKIDIDTVLGMDIDTVLDTDTDTVRNMDTDTVLDTRSSSSYINKTTTTQPQNLYEKFQKYSELWRLTEKGIDSNDLMQIWRREIFKDFDAFLLSVEHIAFYLNSPQSKGIKDPKAWFFSTLSKGFYNKPAGFVSWEQQQLNKELEALEERKRVIAKAKQAKFEKEFQLWLEEASNEEKRDILGKDSVLFRDDLQSEAVKSFLKSAFAKQQGYELTTTDEKEEQDKKKQ